MSSGAWVPFHGSIRERPSKDGGSVAHAPRAAGHRRARTMIIAAVAAAAFIVVVAALTAAGVALAVSAGAAESRAPAYKAHDESGEAEESQQQASHDRRAGRRL